MILLAWVLVGFLTVGQSFWQSNLRQGVEVPRRYILQGWCKPNSWEARLSSTHLLQWLCAEHQGSSSCKSWCCPCEIALGCQMKGPHFGLHLFWLKSDIPIHSCGLQHWGSLYWAGILHCQSVLLDRPSSHVKSMGAPLSYRHLKVMQETHAGPTCCSQKSAIRKQQFWKRSGCNSLRR